MEKDARPHEVFTPATVPVHSKDKVEADIKRDVALGLLENVGENTPMT